MMTSIIKELYTSRGGLYKLKSKNLCSFLLCCFTALSACKNFESSNSTPDAADVSSTARSDALNENMLSPQFKSMRDSFLKVQSKKDLEQWLVQIDKTLETKKASLDSKENDFVFAASLASLSIEFESFVFRCTDLVEDYKSLRSLLVNWVMMNDTMQKVYLPTKQAEAVFAYLTEPQDQGTLKPQIKDMKAFQDALYRVADRYKKVYNTLSAIKLGTTPLVFDNKMVYGTGSFGDDIKRYYEVGEPELQATLAALAMGIHGIYVFNAYNLDNLPELAQNIGHLFGLDGFRWGDPEGTTSKKKVELIRKFDKFWTLKTDTGSQDMAEAYKYFALATNHADVAYKAAKKRDKLDDKEIMSFDRFFINPMRQSLNSIPNKRAVDNLLAMVRGETKVRSQVTGEEITINMREFYLNPPKDLKSLMPVKFVDDGEGPSGAQYKKTAGGVKYRNYSWGSPTGWNEENYKPYLGVSSSLDVQKASRILVQSWGGWLATPLVALAI
jgi:hypothetical protein